MITPDWTKQGDTYTLINNDLGLVAHIFPLGRDWDLTVSAVEGGTKKIKSPNLFSAKVQGESLLGYLYFLELETVPESGCRCGSCYTPTGKWQVWDRADTVEKLFDSKELAVEWCAERYAAAAADAMEALAAFGDPDWQSWVIRGLQHPDPHFRTRTARALRHYPTPGSWAALQGAATTDEHAEVRKAAAETIALMEGNS